MRYYIIAGEASGDLHGSNLMKGLYSEDPDARIRFWGGDLMAKVWATSENGKGYSGLVRHYREGAVMGFSEVIAKAGRLLGNVSMCKKDILAHRPDVVILIDYPGFNFKIAEFAHRHGIRTFYYIAPKVWASREGRIRKLRKYVDRLFIVFPFEISYFQSRNVPFIYKGNPLIDAVDSSQAMNESREDYLRRNSLPDRPQIAMLAGSRKHEISSMMPVLVELADRLHSIPAYRDYEFIIAGAPARTVEDYAPWLDRYYGSPAWREGKFSPSGNGNLRAGGSPSGNGKATIRLLFSQTQSIVRHAHAAVINSGTASLEAVLLNTPQVVGYRVNALTYLVGRLIIKVRYISLGNLCIDRLAFKELIQNDCNAEALEKEVRALIEDTDYRSGMLRDYEQIRSLLGGTGASAAVAKAMIQELAPKA